MTFDDLKAHCPQWQHYIHHPFVQQLADGSLPRKAFRYYLEQDYLFLLQFTRAWALALYKSDNIDQMRQAQAGINAMLDVEIGLHIDYCASYGVGQAQLMALDEHPATVAYTRYVLDVGLQGRLSNLHCALAPCIIGYGEIGAHYHTTDDNPYASWIAMYKSDEYQAVRHAEIDTLNQLLRDVPASQHAVLQKQFNTAVNMEIAFWQMGLDNA
ncbi:thiaminase II [Pasteurellaceae bacterium 20609_3]|uniref:thiaminase II n=1 Tax=Spirabiliibacterium mucosae TaxID=28156 RepID=UPI001AAD2B9E|nr:thiaminase II [Spirabiliibacterium mucosae]MBE2899079.1 thiaminase II [Spirabiliibacterium mucosae]